MKRLFSPDYLKAALGNPALAVSALQKFAMRRVRRRGGQVFAPLVEARGGSAQDVVAALGQKTGVVLLKNAGCQQVIGVADVDFTNTLHFILAATKGASVSLDGIRCDQKSGDLLAKAQLAARVRVSFMANSAGPQVIELEQYQKRGRGHWVSANQQNKAARALFSDVILTLGLHQVADLIGGETMAQVFDETPIDVVYTWVNHADPDWQVMIKPFEISSLPTDAAAPSRFHNLGELRYSLRSLCRNAPWVNRIFIVSNCTPPNWLNLDHTKICWVDHSVIMDCENLPNFNSHAIESYLHHIPDLSEHFVYFNDDMFLCRALDKGWFFNPNGTSRAFLEPYGMVSGGVQAGAPDYLNAARNAQALLLHEYGFLATQLHRHTPYALRKSVLTALEQTFPKAFQATRVNRFRKASDVNVTSFLYHHFAIQGRFASVENAETIMVGSANLDWRKGLGEARENGLDTLCINAGGNDDLSADWCRGVTQFLEAEYPDAADWEVE